MPDPGNPLTRAYVAGGNMEPPKQDPRSIGGLLAWYEADAGIGVADQAAVATWSDLSGNGYDLTQTTAAKQPLFSSSALGGAPGVTFDGANDQMTNRLLGNHFRANGTTHRKYTVVAVAAATGGAGTARHLWDITDYPSFAASDFVGTFIHTDNVMYYERLSGGAAFQDDFVGVTTPTLNLWHTYTSVQRSASIDMFNSYTSAVETAACAAQTMWAASTTTGFNNLVLTVGGFYPDDTTRGWLGHIYGVAIYDRDLSATDANLVQNYFARKLGSSKHTAVNH